MSFYAIACETDHHPSLVPAGNLEEKCSVGGFYLVRTAHPPQVEPCCGGCCLSARRFRNRMGCTAAVVGWRRWLARHCWPVGRYGWWYLQANPLRAVRRRFSPASLPRRLKAFSLKTSTPVGEGGRSHRDTPGPICRVKPTADNSLEKWGGALYNNPFPPCFVSAPPLCRKASLST